MRNLARYQPATQVDIDEVTAVAKAEAEAAGLDVHLMPSPPAKSEVPSRVAAGVEGWAFQRAWTYWIADGPGLPVDAAEQLHATHGKVARVAGHCGCPSPREWYKGFGVGLYHVDTQEGLNALADTIRAVAAANDAIGLPDKSWIIRKHGRFYRPGKSGYTSDILQAGRYTRADAEREAQIETSITAHHQSEFQSVSA